MRTEEAPTMVFTIFIAGDLAHAKRLCREYCYRVGLCVTIEPTTYIYTGGAEDGARIGIINYPRFPATITELWQKALTLADLLRDELYQHSYCVVGPDKTVWSSRRDEA